MLKLTYNWTNSDQSVTDISHLLEYFVILTDIPDDAKAVQISLENRLGLSLFSEPYEIICDYRGCKPSISFGITDVIITGVVCLVCGIFITIGTVFLVKRLKRKKQNKSENFDLDYELRGKNSKEDSHYEDPHNEESNVNNDSLNNNQQNNNYEKIKKSGKNEDSVYIQIEANSF